MMMTGFAFIAGLLQLIVPSYAFRLIRRFGAQRVGWFVVAAFGGLAMLRLLAPLQPFKVGTVPDVNTDILYALGSVLLLIGMGHLETVCREREQARCAQEKVLQQSALDLKQHYVEVARANEQLLEEVGRLELREQALANSVQQYGFLFMENPQPMFTFDLRSGQLLTANKAALRQYGFTAQEFLTLSMPDLLSAEAMDDYEKDIARPCPTAQSRGLWRHRQNDGASIEVHIDAIDLEHAGRPARLVVVHDVTREQRREREFLQTRRMQTISQVSRGVAQHFGAILSGIENQAGSLLPRLAETQSIDQVRTIAAAASRGVGLTRQLLAVGGQDTLQAEVLDLNALVRNLNPKLARLAGEKIILQNTYGSFVIPIVGDPQQIEQAIVSLVLNARAAIAKAGTITISTTTLRFEKSSEDAQSPAGEFVRLTVRDTGCGLSPEVQARLFEPFFTTRGSTQALGLGLAGVYGIVQQHSGWTEFTSGKGAGTEFRLFFPCASAAQTAQMKVKTIAPLTKGTVLLVEADDRTRALARCALNWQGFRVIEADSSALALQFWQSQSSNIDLLLTDVTLTQGISGVELAKQLLEAKPNLKVIYTSDGGAGQSTGARTENFKILAKPLTKETLLQEVQSAFHREA